MISKQFFKSSIIYSGIGALPYVSGVILIPFFAAHLTPQQFGVNVLYFTMMSFFQTIAGFGMDSFIGIHYFEYRDKAKRLRELLGTILLFSITIGGSLIFISSIAGPFAFHKLWPDTVGLDFYPFGLFTILTAISYAFFKVYTSLLIYQQRVEQFFWMSILNFVLTIVVSMTLCGAFPYTLYGPILGRLLPELLSFFLCVILMKREFGLAVDKAQIRLIVAFCTPVLINSLLIWFVSNIDRFLINHFILDTAFVGIFDIAVKITLVIDLIQMGLANAMNPKILTIWKEKNINESTVEVNRYYNGFTALTLLVIPLILIAAPLLIPVVIKKPVYYEAIKYLPVLCLGFATRGMFYMFLAPIYYFKRTRALPKIFFISACIHLFLSIILIKYFGLPGAVWANFIAKPVQSFILYTESRKIFHFWFNRWKMFYLPAIFIAVGIFCETIATDSTRIFLETGQFILTAGLVMVIYKNELFPMVRQWISR